LKSRFFWFVNPADEAHAEAVTLGSGIGRAQGTERFAIIFMRRAE
jgi:hypothetical protein